jgi:outer membrane lipoprotein-sorting protein
MPLWKQRGIRPFTMFGSLLALCLLGIGTGVAWSQADKEQNLDQMKGLAEEIRQAGKEARYQAEQTVYEYLGDKIQTTRYRIQVAFPFRKKENLAGPEGTRIVTLEDGTRLWSYFPDRKIVIKEAVQHNEQSLPVDLPENLDMLLQNYRIYLRGPVVVDDGLKCQVLEFSPRKGDRPSREIWLEENRKLPIRVFMDAPDGRPAYRTELRRILWNPDFEPETFQIKVPKDTKVFEIQKQGNLSVQEAERLLHRRVALPLFVPEGYAPYNVVLRVEERKKRLQMIYSDGLSSYSVFEEWTEPAPQAAAGSAVDAAEGPRPETTTEAAHEARPEAEPGGAAGGSADSAVRPALDDTVPHSYHYGLITVVTYDRAGKRTVAVGDLNGDRLLDVVRSVHEAE